MTNGDLIWSLNDIELADWLTDVLHARDTELAEQLAARGVQIDLVEVPLFSLKSHYEWLCAEAVHEAM